MLSCRVGVQHIEAVEDAVQSALMKALEAWTIAGLPDNPSAWLFRVAHNDLMGELRQRTGRRRILEQYANDAIGTPENGPEGSVRANSFTLPKRQNRISRPLIFLHFSESI